MKDYVYSASLNMICAVALKNDYVMAGTWPADAIDLDEPQALEFMGEAPPGKIMVAGPDNLPVWADLPPLTPAELSEEAAQRKSRLLDSAQETMSIWQTKLLLGRISENEKAHLNAWLDYIDALQAIDISTAPDISWPVRP